MKRVILQRRRISGMRAIVESEIPDGRAEMAFVKAANTGDLAPGSIGEFHVEGKPIAVANVAGKFYAISGTCLHRGGPLGQGSLDGTVVMCPWHAWQFDVTTGKVSGNADVGVACYPLEVRGEEIFVDAG